MHLDAAYGCRMRAPRMLTITGFMVDDSCYLVTLPRPLFVRAGDMLWLESHQQLVVEHLDGSRERRQVEVSTVCWS